MDIEMLSNMLGQLLLDHDSVCLPGVGTFIASQMPATFSDRGYAINPPYRKLTFISGGQDDGLMSGLLASNNSIDQDTAKAMLVRFLLQMREVLADKKSLTLPGLGRLRATMENTFFFIQDEDATVDPDHFGLQVISLKNTRPSEPAPIILSDIPVDGNILTEENIDASLEDSESNPGGDLAECVLENTESSIDMDSAPDVLEEPEVNPVEDSYDETEDYPVVQSEEPAPVPDKKLRWWVVSAVIVGVAALLLAVFMILARVAPDFIDSLLYSSEELFIINS